ncbi:E3 ubiquitin-protein ligase UBR2-like isoform X2 [Ictalurus furcatus]|uniref:E3 ubiquitin-protein ligase UBR2-like isoform X2 n=1 Tax=Ictalurus furcatus TaxID=66913 RepID=UPI00235097BB|nr:E3 ubiquitin-protein ligase UBR2-like isoform X2 [Ictalurus furcatus]
MLSLLSLLCAKSLHATVALVLAPQVESSPCILDVDMFHSVGSLVLSYSALHCLDSSGLSADTAHLHLFHLVIVAHLVQIPLTSVPEQLTMEQEREGEEWEQEESVCLLYNTLRTHVGCLRETSSGWHLWRCVKAGILPFLRGAALFFRHLNGVPIPPELNDGSVKWCATM